MIEGHKISFAIIMRDAEKTIGACLDSVKGFVDEYVIVDTGSKDRSVEIAKAYTPTVHHFEWIYDFSAARNYAFGLCTGDFVFWMDADDTINSEDVEKIKRLKLSDVDMVIMPYNYARDEFGAVISVVPRERFIRRSLNRKWEEPIHECVPLRDRQRFENIPIQHHKQHGTSERNLEILEKIVWDGSKFRDNINSRNIYYLGKEYQDFGKLDKAIVCLTEFVRLSNGFWEDIYYAWYKLALCYLQLNNESEFFRCIFESIKIEPRRAEPYYQLGDYYIGKQKWNQAIHWFKMCLSVEKPADLLASYQPEYYGWLPHLQLCVCYNNIGDVRKAFEHNEEVLKVRPKDSRAINNRNILLPSITGDRYRKDGEGKKLNLGCGNKPVPGYVNVDIFRGGIVDEVFDLSEIPYKAGTIAGIHSEHALEHLPFDDVRDTLKEWYRVLKPGGELLLKIPDLEQCCRSYLDAPINHQNFFKTRHWFKCTIYGIQKGQAGEPDEAQFHRSGFSKEEINILLTDAGFVISSIENYDGWGTPSISIRAMKAIPSPKIGWVSVENWDAAQTRIRVLNVDRWLKSQGYWSKVVDYPTILRDGYDIAIVGKSFSEGDYNAVRDLKKNGKTVYADLCESIFEFPWVKEVLGLCDKVLCCSHALAEQTRQVNPNVEVIEDAWES